MRGSDSKGYVRYDLSLNGKRSVVLGHRLVAETFLPKIDGKEFINHIDGDKANNHIDNLEWCTKQENAIHAVRVLGMSPVNKRKVICIETQRIYQSAVEAELDTGIPNSCIIRCCKGTRKSAGGKHWEYIHAGVAQ